MAVKDHEIMIVGCGPGSPDYITAAGLRAIREAETLVGADRLLAVFGGDDQERIPLGADVTSALDRVAAIWKTRKVVVLVSGDPGLKSLAANVINRFGRDCCRVIPGISSVQTAFARLCLDWDDARIISAHEGTPLIAPASLSGEVKIAVLAGGRESMAWIEDAARVLARDYRIYLCQDLTLETERVELIGQGELEKRTLSSRSVVLFIKEDGTR